MFSRQHNNRECLVVVVDWKTNLSVDTGTPNTLPLNDRYDDRHRQQHLWPIPMANVKKTISERNTNQIVWYKENEQHGLKTLI